MPPDAVTSVLATDVEVRELGESRPDVRPDNPDSDHSPTRKSSQCDAARGEIALTLGAPVSDRVLSFTFGEPGRCAEIAEPLFEAVTMLHVEGVDPFGSIDLADPRQVCGDEPPVRDPTYCGWLVPRPAFPHTL